MDALEQAGEVTKVILDYPNCCAKELILNYDHYARRAGIYSSGKSILAGEIKREALEFIDRNFHLDPDLPLRLNGVDQRVLKELAKTLVARGQNCESISDKAALQKLHSSRIGRREFLTRAMGATSGLTSAYFILQAGIKTLDTLESRHEDIIHNHSNLQQDAALGAICGWIAKESFEKADDLKKLRGEDVPSVIPYNKQVAEAQKIRDALDILNEKLEPLVAQEIDALRQEKSATRR